MRQRIGKLLVLISTLGHFHYVASLSIVPSQIDFEDCGMKINLVEFLFNSQSAYIFQAANSIFTTSPYHRALAYHAKLNEDI
jgi:hypothetical protein